MDSNIIGAKRGEEGFTVAELLVSVLVSVIVLAAISASFMVQNKSFTAQEQIVETQQNARAALQLMTKELLMAGYDPMGTADAGIEEADSNTVQFTMDLNGNGTLDSDERIVYALDTTENQVTRNGQPMAENIEVLSFSYFDGDGTELTGVPLSSSDKERVTRVSVEVTPRATQSASFNLKEGGAEEAVIRLAYAGAARVRGFVREVLTPPYAFADVSGTQSDRKLKDGVAPPNLGKTRTGADTGGGSGSGTGGGTGYETGKDETWATDASSSSSS